MAKNVMTKTMTAMLSPESPRINSYLWLTHRLWSHQLEFVVSEYLQLRRAAEIARAKGDITKATEKLGTEGKAAVKHKFEQFVDRFVTRYGLTKEEAVVVALRMGEMSDYFLVAPEGAEVKEPTYVHGFVNQLTSLKPEKDRTPENFIKVAPNKKPHYINEWLAEFHQRGILLFEREKMLGVSWSEKLFNAAKQHIRSQGEIRKMREKEREKWEADRNEFMSKHDKFFAEKYTFFEEYEKERTNESQTLLVQSQNRNVKHEVRIRDHMVKGINAVLSAWADEGLWKPKKPFDKSMVKSRIERRKQIFNAIRSSDIEKYGDHRFFEWVAEHADDWHEFADDLKILLDYNFKYLDDRKPKSIGFSRPSFDKHPIWYELEECFDEWPDTKYFKADFAERVLYMRVVVPKTDTVKIKGNDRWNSECDSLPALTEAEIDEIVKNPSLATILPVHIPFKPDSRLRDFASPNPSFDRKDKEAKFLSPYLYKDEITHERYPFRLGGIKLVFRPRPVSRTKSKPYVYFSTQTLMPFEKQYRAKPDARKLESGTRVLAIDLGHRHRAFGVVREYNEEGNSTQIWAGPIKPKGGRHLSHVDSHEEAHKKNRSDAQKSRTGKMRFLKRGQEFDKDFRDHIVNMKDDIAKQTAHAIVETAIDNKASIIVMEQLDNYKPQTDRTRRENRRLRTTAFRSLYHELTSEKGQGKNAQGVDRAGAYGLVVYSYSAVYTSRVCHKCGWPGMRFVEIQKGMFKKWVDKDGIPITHRKIAGKDVVESDAGKVLIQQGGKLFCCSNPDCDVVKINADYNAAQNLHRQFAAQKGEKLIDMQEKVKGDGKLLKHPWAGYITAKEYWKFVEESVVEKIARHKFKIVK